MKIKQLSTCILTQNNADTIELCLRSVAPFSGEVVVVDGGSTDQTLATVRRYTNAVYEIPWPHDYAKQRNACIERAKGQWILMIDSDEFVGLNFGGKIKSLIQKHDFPGYMFFRKWLIPTRPLSYIKNQRFYHAVSRLIRKDFWQANRFSQVVHEDVLQLFGDHPEKSGFAVVREFFIYHLCLFQNRHERVQTVRYYDGLQAGAGVPDVYLYEDYPYETRVIELQEMPKYAWDYVSGYTNGVNGRLVHGQRND